MTDRDTKCCFPFDEWNGKGKGREEGGNGGAERGVISAVFVL